MPKEYTLEELEAIIPDSPEKVNKAVAARTAETTLPIPSPSAALGRENVAGDILGLGSALTKSFFDPTEALQGFPALRESFKSSVTPQTKPRLEFLKGSDVGRALPDIAQAVPVEIGQALGARYGGTKGAVAGGAAGSLLGNVVASKMQEFSPELFGENLGTVNIAGEEIPTEAFNLMMDAGMPMLNGLPRLSMQEFKNQTARALVKIAGQEAPEEVGKAYQYLTNPANEVDISLLPDPSTASFGGPLEAIEQIASIRGKQKLRDTNAIRHREFLKNQGGLSEGELQDISITKDRAEEVNALPFRKESIPVPINRIPVDPETARGVDILARSGKVFNNLKAAADSRFKYVRDTLARQGDTTIPLNEGVVSNLMDIHKRLSDLIEGTPELAQYYGGPKSTIENLLNLPKVSKSVTKKGDTIVTLEKTIETPKALKTTTGRTETKATETGKTKEFQSETLKQGIGAEGAISAPILANRTEGVQTTTNVPGAVEEPVLTTAIDYNSLLSLNSELKRSISRGSVIDPKEIPVVQTIGEINKAIEEGLKSKPNGDTLLKKHQEGFNITTDRYRTFNPQIERILGGAPKDVWPKILKDVNVANAFVRATGSRTAARKEAFAHLIENSFDSSGQFEPRKALNMFNDSPGMKELMTPQQKKTVQQFLTYSSGVTQDVSDIGKFSVAMRSGNIVASLGSGALFATGAASPAAAVATLWFGGRRALSKILLDPEAAKIATGLLKTPARSPRALGDLRRLMRFMNGEKVIVNVGNQSFETTVDSDLLSRVKFANKQQPNQTYDLLNRVQEVQ